jgi:hypothetical protein
LIFAHDVTSEAFVMAEVMNSPTSLRGEEEKEEEVS